jgi:hypothetical protein
MDRLTIEYCGEYVPKEMCSIDRLGGADDCDLCCEYCEATKEGKEDCRGCAINQCFNLLGEYENTGLTPREILDGKMLTGWIPCNERLPEDPVPDAFYGLSEMDTYPEYIVMIAGAQEPTFLKYAGSGEWYRDGNFYKVIAWMPLPAPYKKTN